MNLNQIAKGTIASFIAASIVLALSNFIQKEKFVLTLQWQSDTLLRSPESVIYDPFSKVLYVSNINGKPWEKDGNGFISKISLSGKIENLKWITGLDAPKGLGIYKNKLYIADINKVVIADIQTGLIEKSIEAPEAQTLNDIAIDINGKVYISDSAGKKIYILRDTEITVWLENPDWKRPNGLLAQSNTLRMVDADAGIFYSINYSDKKSTATAQGLTKGDGIVQIVPEGYLISNWNGEVNYVKERIVEKILDTKDIHLNAADIWYIPSEKLLIIPPFYGNKVVAYQLTKHN